MQTLNELSISLQLTLLMKFGRTIRYPVAELVVWTEQNRATPLDRSIGEKR
jgi:hypothetical protein